MNTLIELELGWKLMRFWKFTTEVKSLNKGSVQAAKKGIQATFLPKPYHVSLLQKELNSKLTDFVGEYYSIDNSFEIPPHPKI